MALDASIFQNIKPVEVDTYGDQQRRQLANSQLAVQNRRGEQEAAAAEREAGMQKLNVIGSAMESISGLDPAARAQAYPQVRNQLVQAGVLKPEEAPEQHDEGFYQSALRQYKQGMEYAKRQNMGAQTAKLYAEAKGEGNKGQGLEAGSSLRKEWTGLPTTKATQDVAQSIERVRNAYQNPSPASDLTMIYSFMKMNDPGSTVREGEFATAQNAASVPERIRNAYNKVMQGERLGEDQRADFANQAEKMYGGQLNAQKTIDSQYAALAGRYGVDPQLVMMKFPDPREFKAAIREEQEKPGFLARLFGGETAEAGAPKRPKAPPGTILMVDPRGRQRFVPEAQKGEAIAAGGSVVE